MSTYVATNSPDGWTDGRHFKRRSGHNGVDVYIQREARSGRRVRLFRWDYPERCFELVSGAWQERPDLSG